MLDKDISGKVIGSRLKELRETAGRSMEEECASLNRAYNLKIGKGMMSRWETGKSQPSNNFLCAYALHHNIDLNYLVGLSDIKKPLCEDCSQLPQGEYLILAEFRRLNPTGQSVAIEQVKTLAKQAALRTDTIEPAADSLDKKEAVSSSA